MNDDISLTREFHNNTKYPDGQLLQIHPNLFDPTKRPNLFKHYLADLDSIELTIPDEVEDKDALLTLVSNEKPEERFPYFESLGKLLYYSAGITKTLKVRNFSIPFRAASCTGALFHIEIYIVCSRLPGLRAGIYHYNPEASALTLLRKGDYRKAVFEASRSYTVEDAPVTLIYTSTFWRNAYKYQGRVCRHAFWDGGTMISQSLAMATALDLHAEVVMGFVDDAIVTLLGIDLQSEFPIALLPLGYSGVPSLRSPPSDKLDPLPAKKDDLQKQFPPIVDFIRASSLQTEEAIKQFRKASPPMPSTEGGDLQLRPQSTRKMTTVPLEELIPKRGSTRQFSQDPLDLDKFSNLMKMGTSFIPADFYPEFGGRLNEIYVVIHNVTDISMGLYRFFPASNRLALIKAGYFREESKEMGVGQALAHDAAAIVYFVADLEVLLSAYGNRGYRVGQLEGGILGGKMYLAAFAQGFGATGLTFSDDKVIEFLTGPNSTKMVSFMICLGHRLRK